MIIAFATDPTRPAIRAPFPPVPRSRDPQDYQALPRPVAVMAKSFPDGFEIAAHTHLRDQLLYAVRGSMRVRTEREAWIVPPDRAVYLPAGTAHSLSIHGELQMRTLYLAPGAAPGLPATPTVLEVSGLLRVLVLALLDEPLLYEKRGRGGVIARLILSEIGRARRLPLVLPMPRDRRLLRVCTALLADPASPRTLEQWADLAGASARTLARLFEREVGLSFARWRQRVRFHGALELLVTGEPIARVAAATGYRSLSAFSAAFRKIMGLTPSSLRADADQTRPLGAGDGQPHTPGG